MLNELEEVRHSLAAHGIGTESWHPWIQPLRKGVLLLAELNDTGIPVRVTAGQTEQIVRLRNIQPDNQKSFPAFNLASPIFALAEQGAPPSANLSGLRDTLESLNLAYKPKDVSRLQRLLGDFPSKTIAPQFAHSDSLVLASTRRLLEALAKRPGSAEDFLRNLARAMVASAASGELPTELLMDVLFGKRSGNGCHEAWQSILFLDINDLSSVSHRVADHAVAVAWSDVLLFPKEAEKLEPQIVCALTGDTGESVGRKMPNPTLPLLGGTYLLSMNSEIPCQTRYNQTSTDIFPVTKHTVQTLNDALLHITHLSRKGKTWDAVPNGSNDKPDLLIAYLEQDIEGTIPVVSMLGASDEQAEESETEGGAIRVDPRSRFEARTSDLIEKLKLRAAPTNRDDYLRLFVLSTIDPGRKQVLFDARYQVQRLFAAQERWVQGAKNTPEVNVRLLRGKGKKPQERHGYVPFPSEVLSSFRQQWIRLGEMNQKVPGIDLRRIYALLLDERIEKEASWMLARYLPLNEVLLIGAGRAVADKKTGQVYTYTAAALSPVARRDLLTVFATYGILLHALGRTKEIYMDERDYLLGQFLQYADRLHLFYCQGVRSGEIPPQLIGNAHVSMALQNPRKALDVIAERMPVYIAYATKQAAMVEKEAAFNEAAWLKQCIGEISIRLNELGIDQSVKNPGKAELLLGYLAVPQNRAHVTNQQATDR
jgi:hypothetical protein